MSLGQIKNIAYKKVTNNFGDIFIIALPMLIAYFIYNISTTSVTITKDYINMNTSYSGSLSLIAFILLLIYGMLSFGFSLTLNINIYNKEDVNKRRFILFSSLKNFFKAILILLVSGIIIYIGLIFLIIPGFIFALMYSQSLYLFANDLLNNNEIKSVQEYLKMSRKLMNGHKWELFTLYLSLIGWAILMIIPFSFIFIIPYLSYVRMSYFDYVYKDNKVTTNSKSDNNIIN